jgi:gamma-glutamyltranspeptidase/glutathione hydrolase
MPFHHVVSELNWKSYYASGVPGELRGLEFLQKTHGKLDWQTVVQPSVSLARSGFPVTEDLVYYMDSVSIDGHDFLTSNKTWATDFAPNGTRLRPGDIMTRTRLADTLDTISKQGANAFYDGTIANSTISALKADGGIMTLEDLKNYSIIIRNPANIEYRGYKVFSTTAPSSGAIVLSILKTLEGYGPLYNPGEEKLTAHRLDEAMRFGYARVRATKPVLATIR